MNFWNLRLRSVIVARESSGAASAKKASEEFKEPTGTSFLGGILSTTSDLASSLAMSPVGVPWKLTQEAVTEAGSSVPGPSPVSEGVLDFLLARA